MISILSTSITIIIVIFSIILHEVSHGYMADFLGDPTPRLQGRLTLNPLKHLEMFGSIVVPIVSYMLFHTMFGWAKPVVYNPYNIKNKRQGEFLIALAGPATNIALALIFGTIIRFVYAQTLVSSPFIEICSYVVVINIVLALFNLIPVPPLDGSKILFSILSPKYNKTRFMFEAYAPVFVLIAVFFLWNIISPIIPLVFKLFTGFYIG